MKVLLATILATALIVTCTKRSDAGPLLNRSKASTAIAANLASSHTSSSIASDALQAVGQVVLKKAARAGWSLLKQKLENLARCGDPNGHFANSCKVLDSAQIQEIVGSPRVLLDAVLTDFLESALARLGPNVVKTRPLLEVVIAGWHHGRVDGVVANLRSYVLTGMKGQVSAAKCPSDIVDAALWVMGSCVALPNSPVTDYWRCPIDAFLDDPATGCAASIRPDVRQLALMGERVLSPKDQISAKALVELLFEFARASDSSASELFGGLRSVFVGIVDHDWMQAVHGMVVASKYFAKRDCAPATAAKGCKNLEAKFFALLAGVGEYAETYRDNKNDPAAGQAAREKVIEDLVESMTARSDRDGGAVISLGGSLAVFGGARFNSNGAAPAWPLSLTLGFGLHTYHKQGRGLHLTIDAFDLAQYVTYSSGGLHMKPPDVESSVIFGGSIGYWFGSRETPVFIAARAAVSPFVRTSDDKVSYQAGIAFGLYLPLLDFN